MASRESRLGSLEPMNQAIMHVVVITSFNLRCLLPSILCFFAAFTCVFVFFFRPGLGMNITSILRFFEIKRLRKVYHLLVQ